MLWERHVVQLGAKVFATGRDSSVSSVSVVRDQVQLQRALAVAALHHALYQNGIGAIAKAPRIIAVLTTCHLYNTSTPVGGHAGCCGAAFPAACA